MKGEREMHNKAKAAKSGEERAPLRDSFGKRGHKEKHNEAPPSKDRKSTAVTDDAGSEVESSSATAQKSHYDPASGKRARSIADLREAAKRINERSLAGEYSPTAKQGSQEGGEETGKASGWMKAGLGKLDSKSKKAPRSLASQETDEGEDPMDAEQDGSDETEEGMTPMGTSRKSSKHLKKFTKRAIAKTMVD